MDHNKIEAPEKHRCPNNGYRAASLECMLEPMPFRHIPPGQFSVDLLKRMQAAYDDDVRVKLQIDSTNDPRSSKLANIIMDLAASEGEQLRLSERALEIVTETDSEKN